MAQTLHAAQNTFRTNLRKRTSGDKVIWFVCLWVDVLNCVDCGVGHAVEGLLLARSRTKAWHRSHTRAANQLSKFRQIQAVLSLQSESESRHKAFLKHCAVTMSYTKLRQRLLFLVRRSSCSCRGNHTGGAGISRDSPFEKRVKGEGRLPRLAEGGVCVCGAVCGAVCAHCVNTCGQKRDSCCKGPSTEKWRCAFLSVCCE
jgi:hypothetical protein